MEVLADVLNQEKLQRGNEQMKNNRKSQNYRVKLSDPKKKDLGW